MDALPKSQFWMVYGHGQRAPTYIHESVRSAQAEAQRLARAHPGICFVILEAVEAVAKQEFVTFRYRGRRDLDAEIPF